MIQLLFNVLDRIQNWTPDPALTVAICAVYAIALAYFFGSARKNYAAIPELKPRPAQPQPPDCMAVIPARNEGGTIARVVKSLPADSVIVVDDNSNDGTAKEAESAGAGVLRAGKLPKGALGKPHACMVGAQAIGTKWILFADADTWFEPGVMESLLHAAEAADLSFLSLHLEHVSGTFSERLITPLMQALFFAGINPRTSPEGAFLGHCVLVRRAAYEFIGGHGASLSFLMDDVKLALLAQRHRLNFGLVRTSSLGHVRYHVGWDGLMDGVQRNAYRFVLLEGSQGVAAAGAYLTATLWLPLALLLGLAGQPLASVAITLMPMIVLWPWYGASWAWSAPLAIYAAIPIVVNAVYNVLTTTHVPWKGREV